MDTFGTKKNSPCSSGQYDNWICGLLHRLREDSKPIIFFQKQKKILDNAKMACQNIS